jgi:O-antigen/teichoic acid export membrane protein
MGIVIKQSAQATIASYLGLALGFFSFLVLFPLLLSKEQIGLIRILEESTSLLATLALAGAPNLGIRYFAYFQDAENGNNGFLRLLLLLPLFGITLVVLGMTLFDSSLRHVFADPLLVQYWHYIIPITIANMYSFILDIYCRCNFVLFIPTLLREVGKRVIIIIAGLGIWFGYADFQALILWFMLSHFILLFGQLLYMQAIKLIHLQSSPNKLLTLKLGKEMLDVSIFQTIGNLGGLLIGKLDTLMVVAIAGLADTGVYGMSAKLILLMELPRLAIQGMVMPLIAKAYKENDLQKIQELYQKTALNQLILCCFLLLILWCNADAIFTIIPNGDAFKAGKIVILYLGLSKLIDMGCGVNYEILAFSQYYRFSAVLNLGLMLVAVFINYYCILWGGFVGAGAASVIIVILFNVVRGSFLWYKIRIQPFHRNVIWVVLTALIIAGIEMLPPHYTATRWTALLDATAHSAAITLVFFFIIIKFQLSDDITNELQNKWKKLRRI